MKKLELENMSAALQILLMRREQDKLELEENVLPRDRDLAMPNPESPVPASLEIVNW